MARIGQARRLTLGECLVNRDGLGLGAVDRLMDEVELQNRAEGGLKVVRASGCARLATRSSTSGGDLTVVVDAGSREREVLDPPRS